MYQTVVSCQSIVWTLISLIANILLITSIFTGSWLSRVPDEETRRILLCPGLFRSANPSTPKPLPSSTTMNNKQLNAYNSLTPRLGPLVRCRPLCDSRNQGLNNYPGLECQIYLIEQLKGRRSMHSIGGTVTVVLLLLCLVSVFLADIAIGLSPLVRDVAGYSVFSIAGIFLCLSDLLLFTSLVVWPTGWDSASIREVCGGAALFYNKGRCQLDWGFYGTLISTVLLFVAAILSIFTEKSIMQSKVQRRMLQGESFLYV